MSWLIHLRRWALVIAVPIHHWVHLGRLAPRRRSPGSIVLLLLTVQIGCESARPPELQTESLISAASGTVEPVTFCVEGGHSDEPNDPESLTLSDAVRQAVTTDPGVQASLARVRIALAEAKQTRLLPNPILNLALRFPQGGGSPVFEASLAQDLISILRMPRQASAADHRLRRASADAVTTTIDVVAQVQERYVTAQSLEQLLLVLAERRALTMKVLDLAKARLAVGEGTRDDVTLLHSQRVELEVEIAQANQELRDERLRLARLIGRPSGAGAWKLDPWVAPELTDVGETKWIELGLRARPEVQAAAWKLSALGDELTLTRLLPFDGLDAGVQAERDGAWGVGPEVSIPIPVFDMGQARAERVTAEQMEARHELVQARRQVVEDVRRALESLSRTRDSLRRVREELIPLQEQRRKLAEASFRAGQSDVTAIHLAEQDLRAAEARTVDLNRHASVAAIRLQRAAGGPGPAATVGRTNSQLRPATSPFDVSQ